jgi:hypothetical protein
LAAVRAEVSEACEVGKRELNQDGKKRCKDYLGLGEVADATVYLTLQKVNLCQDKLVV